jgi:concanavalin A-like lectin/glucanase superfamily protein
VTLPASVDERSAEKTVTYRYVDSAKRIEVTRMTRWIAFLTTTMCAVLLIGSPAAAHDPIAAWRFDEGVGNMAVDDGPFKLDAGWPAAGGPTWIAGVAGTALHFDGDDEVVVPDHRALEPAAITIAAWVRAAESPGTYRYIFSKGAASCLRSSYGLYTGPHGGVAFYVAGDGWFTLSPQAPREAVWDGRWHRVTGTFDGTRVRLYVDGDEVGAGTPGPTQIEYRMVSRTPYIGSYHGECRLPFAGDLDGVAIWSDALSQTRISADAEPPAETPESGPIGRAPGAPAPGESGFDTKPGSRTTPAGCTSVSLNRRTLRAARRSRLVVTVRRGSDRRSRARVVLRARRLRQVGRTDARGRVRFVVRPSRAHRRIQVRVAVASRGDCGTAIAYLRVRR